MLLEQTMQKHGFTPYFAEWWHFSDSQDYPVDETFDPAIPVTWLANCNEYISLRSTPGGEVIATVLNNETVELKSWAGKHAQVRYRDLEGYVLSSYIMPEQEDYLDVCYHIIPMSNPDGVAISQTGVLTETQHDIYLSDKANGYTSMDESDYAAAWKANGEGVDINRNFPSGWELIDDRIGPSSQQYQGTEPFSTSEALALRDYTLKYDFDATVSYHATGSMIFYSYGEKEPVNTQSRSLAKAVGEISGYELVSSSETDGAGYKDWAMDELQIPSVTIEIGCGEAPLAEREIHSIFVRNYRLLPTIAWWLQRQ